MKKCSLFFLTFPVLFFVSCGNDGSTTDYKDAKILTERIQYDVFIKSPDPDLDWWTQNIEGSKRETFVKTILDLAYTGKLQAYDYFNAPLTVEEVKAIDNRNDTIGIADVDNPTIVRDTVIKHELDIQRITKVRFLEEWYLNEKNLNFEKKVCGVALIKENYDDSANLRGYTPLFWVYFDKDYPAKMK